MVAILVCLCPHRRFSRNASSPNPAPAPSRRLPASIWALALVGPLGTALLLAARGMLAPAAPQSPPEATGT